MSFWALACVAACGGGGESSRNSGTGPTDPLTFIELESGGDALADKYRSVQLTDPATLPVSGSATYDGFLGIIADGISAGGEMRLTANFDTGAPPFTGTVRNIVDADEQSYAGTLIIDNAVLDRSANPLIEDTFGADLRGSVTRDEEGFAVNARMRGDFLGPDHRGMAGDITGIVSTSFGSAPITAGAFIGER